MKRREEYSNPVQMWRVTTEGDVEGRPTRELGVYDGHIADIARMLSGEAYYSLTFAPAIDRKKELRPALAEVSVKFDIDSGTWPNEMTSEERVKFFRRLISGHPSGKHVKVEPGTTYASVNFEFDEASRQYELLGL